MFRKRWEVYRVIPQRWRDELPQKDWPWSDDTPYFTCYRRKTARRIAAEADWTLRNGRSDEDFAAFKVRKIK